MKLLLASNSPRRRQMLVWTGWNFEVRPADIDESQFPGEAPLVYVQRLAREKARAAAHAEPGLWVVAADTIVVDDGEVLGKPGSPAEARRMLVQLRSRTHQVYTALAVLDPSGQRLAEDVCVSQVPMRAYSDPEIEAYIASGDPFDKAGGYAIQHPSFHPVENFMGCFASVMGFPLCHLARTLSRMEVQPPANIPQTCQTNLNYACLVFSMVLAGENAG